MNYEPERFELGQGFDLDDVITLEIEGPTATLEADGASELLLVAMIPEDADRDRRTVTFTTPSGAFFAPDGSEKKSIEVVADAVGRAAATLRAPISLRSAGNTDTARVSASIRGYARDAAVVFERAHPQRLRLEASVFALPASFEASATLTVRLSRDTGRPTAGTEVAFSAPVGEFRNITTSNADGVATAAYTPGDTGARGPVTLTASYDGPDGSSLSATTELVLRPPNQ